MLVVEGLTKKYGNLTAVDNLSLTIDKASIFGFIGPNGAGKTTTLKILATLLRPTSGRAWIAGEEVTGNPKRVRQLVGYMPDFFGVYDDLRVDEYLDFYAASYGIPSAQRKRIIGDLLELVDLAHKRNAYVDSLSRGMKQRLCLSRCLVHDPAVIILDEPASGLDPRARIEVKEILKELRNMGKTIIVSSHILPELAEFCTHMGIIEAGRMIVNGTVEEISRRAISDRVIQIAVLDKLEEAVMLLQTQFDVKQMKVENNQIDFPFSGDDKESSAILSALVGTQIPVIYYARARNNMEDIFIELTKGVVQ